MFNSALGTGWFVVIVTASLAMILVFFFLLFIQSSRRHVAQIKKVHKIQKDFDQVLLQSRLEIQEQTFNQISQEIHDNIGQMLTLVKLHLRVLEQELGEGSIGKFGDVNNMLTNIIQDLRDIARSMNSDSISHMGIVKAIQTELGIIGKITKIETNCDCDTSPLNLDPHVELILFRIIQESLHNIIKHAKATSIKVSMTHEENVLLVKIKDDGEGFDISAASRGSGLQNMKSRCSLINADFEIESLVGEGTEVRLKLLV